MEEERREEAREGKIYVLKRTSKGRERKILWEGEGKTFYGGASEDDD